MVRHRGGGCFLAGDFWNCRADFRTSPIRCAVIIIDFVPACWRCAVWAIHTLNNGSEGRGLAIVTGNDVQARLATADTANSVLALPPGSEIKILSTRGDWMYAALPNDLRGWIQTKNAEQVRL